MDPLTLAAATAVMAAINYFGGAKSRRKKKRARKKAAAARYAALKSALGSLEDEERNVLRASDQARAELDVSFAERGLGDATAEEQLAERIDTLKKEQIDAINRRRAALVAGAEAERAVSDAQAAADRWAMYSSMLGSILQGGGVTSWVSSYK